MDGPDFDAMRARAAEREKHFQLVGKVPSGLDERAMLRGAHADIAALLEHVASVDDGACPFCRSAVVVAIEDMDGQLILCRVCGGRGPSCETEAEAWTAWNRRG